MGETDYGNVRRRVKQKNLEFTIKGLYKVPHGDGMLIVSRSPFGPNSFENNIKEMCGHYSHPETGKVISFRAPTTAESISVAAFDFDNGNDISRPYWLQLGYIVRTSEGIVANPPKNLSGKPIVDEKILKSYIDKSEEIDRVRFYDGKDAKDFGFAPYETFDMAFITTLIPINMEKVMVYLES